MGHYDDIIEEENERRRQEEERRRTIRCEEIKAIIIRDIKDMNNDEIEFMGKVVSYMPALFESDMEFILEIMKDLPAYRGFFKVLRNK